jgi:transposase
VAMEACSSAHHWARKLRALGLDARLIAANFVTPYRMEGKNGKEERTACINQIRGVLMEFGLVFGKSPKVLRAVLTDVIEDATNELSTMARLVVQRAFDHCASLTITCAGATGRSARICAPAQRPSVRPRIWVRTDRCKKTVCRCAVCSLSAVQLRLPVTVDRTSKPTKTKFNSGLEEGSPCRRGKSL